MTASEEEDDENESSLFRGRRPVTDLKADPGKVISQVDKTHRPVLLTRRGGGGGGAVGQGLRGRGRGEGDSPGSGAGVDGRRGRAPRRPRRRQETPRPGLTSSAKEVRRVCRIALVDLEALRAWYVEQDVYKIGARFLAEIFAQVEQLAEFPESGRISRIRAVCGARVCIRRFR